MHQWWRLEFSKQQTFCDVIKLGLLALFNKNEMQFFTKVPLVASQKPIDYNSKIVSIGSCFAANMGEKFAFFKFQNTTNPFGIIFNPVSIEKLIRRAIRKDFFSEKDIFFHEERWHCFEVHSELSHPDKDFYLTEVNKKLELLCEQLSTASHFIVTLGTSWVYKTKDSREIVANCHKIPQKLFDKHLLSASEISSAVEKILQLVLAINPACQFIFTVSPVRHIKDGFVQNQVSKSHLITAVFDIVKHHHQYVYYFPSYEIMMDELRDYRFYSADLLHPNATAVDYIWSRFVETSIDNNTILTMKEVATVQNGLKHRAFNPESTSHQKFLQKLDEKMQFITELHPSIKF